MPSVLNSESVASTFPYSGKGQTDKLLQSGIGCDHPLVLGDFTKLSAVTFHCVCRVEYPPYVFRVVVLFPLDDLSVVS